jgi:hypothetical protein
MDAHFETLAAWADGEPVDRTAVLEALTTNAGREYVVDLMALRHLVTTTPMASHSTWPQAAVDAPHRRSLWPALVATAAAVVCVVGGYAVGRLAAPGPASSEVEVIPVVAPSTSAPTPTHVIRFESGVDWRETVGGN